MRTDNDLLQCSLKDLNLQPTPSYRREEQDSGSAVRLQEGQQSGDSGEDFPEIGPANRYRTATLDKCAKFVQPEPNTGCWLWTGAIVRRGYGVVRRGGRTLKAHRYIYQLLRGPIPSGLEIDHLCRVTSCVNPDHLEPVTKAENLRRGNSLSAVNARKVTCVRGHPFTDENTRIYPNGSRVCRTCLRARAHHRALDRQRREGAA